jgi:PAS domain S-box-containing protein
MPREGDGAEEPLSSREQELRRLVETSPGVIWRAELEGYAEFVERLQATLNVIPAYTWYAASSGGLTFVNKRTADYLGLPEDHHLRFGIDIGAQWDAHVPLLHPDDQEETRMAWSTCLRTGQAGEVSFRVRNAQRGYRWFLSRAEPLLASDGALLLWVGVNLDIEERKRAEQALRESEFKLRKIVETMPGLHWSAGADGEPTMLNQRVLEYSGLQFSDFLQQGWERFLHPDDFPGTAQAFYDAIQTGTTYHAVHRLRRADGEYRWYRATAEPLRDERGRVIQWYGLSIDIDESKKAEDLLRRSEAHLAEAQRLTHIGVGVFNGTEILFWSEETYRIWGFDPVLGVPSREAVLQRINPEDRDRMHAEVQRALGEKRRYSIDYKIVLPDGTVKYLQTIGVPEFSASGKLVEIVVTQIDETEHRRTERSLRENEEALRRNEAWLAQAQRLSHTGNWVYDATTTRYLYWSDESYRMWGFDPLQGLPSRENMWQRIHPDDRDGVLEEVQEALREQRDFAAEFRILLPDGTIKYLEATTRHKFSPLGALIEAISSHVDVTERKHAQEEHERLHQLEADLAHMHRLSMMGELAASLAHEIAQPIATARNNARAALNFSDRGPTELGQVREALTAVVDDADRAGEILGRIRDHIKKAPPRKERVDLNQAITDVIALAQGAIIKNGVSVQTRLMEGLPDVEVDRVQVQQVVLNLILNAVEAMSLFKNGARELAISTERRKADSVLVAVRDSGPGIDPNYLDRVFDAFYTTKSSGVGIGLSICRSIIDAHGGRLWADANEPRGAVFQFILPSSKTNS